MKLELPYLSILVGHVPYCKSGLYLHPGAVFCSVFLKLQGQMAKLGLEKKLFTLNRHFCAPRGWKGVPLLYIAAIGNMGMKPQYEESGKG